jgi:hypothetical protein
MENTNTDSKHELSWFLERIGKRVLILSGSHEDEREIRDAEHANDCFNSQNIYKFTDVQE